jgi:hypothetical protein
MQVDFPLGKGQYVTMLLRELVDLSKGPPVPPGRRHTIFPDSDTSDKDEVLCHFNIQDQTWWLQWL